MTLAFLSSTGQVGGTEVVILEIFCALRRAHPDWTFGLVVPSAGPLPERARRLGLDAHVLSFPGSLVRLGESGRSGAQGGRWNFTWQLIPAGAGAFRYAWRLGRLLRRLRPDIVHAHGFKMQVLAALASPPHATVVWHLHDYLASRRMTPWILRSMAGHCAHVIANSDSVAIEARASLGAAVPIATVHNAVDLGRFTPAGPRLDLDALAGLPPAPAGAIRVGLIATFGYWKGHRVFLEALARLPERSAVRSYVVGDALYETEGSQVTTDELRLEALRLGLDGRVGFTGFVEDVPSVMRSLDIVVHASTAPEPFGMVIAEAMACGRPVIASAAGGAAEIIQSGVDALGHPPGDVQALTECIARLVQDPGLRTRLGRAARASAERRFDRTRLSAEVSRLYERAMRASRAGLRNPES